jgi:hypothetical protein
MPVYQGVSRILAPAGCCTLLHVFTRFYGFARTSFWSTAPQLIFMKITAILKGRIGADEKQAIQLRINCGEKRTFIPTRIRVLPTQFAGGWVVDHPMKRVLNDKLRSMIAAREAAFFAGSVLKYPDANFRDYLYRCIDQWEKEKKTSTTGQYKTEGEKFLEWAGEIKLSRITLELLNEYKGYLFKRYDPNTVAKSFKNLCAIIGKAVQEKVIEHDPLAEFKKPPFISKKRPYLLGDDMEALDKVAQDERLPEPLRHAANWFLIGCYSGLRHSDMRQFCKKEHIKGGRLSLETVKTGDIVGMPVKGKLQELLERVDYHGLRQCNQKFNEYLKLIAEAP